MKRETLAFLIVIVLATSVVGAAYVLQQPTSFSLQVYPGVVSGGAIAGQWVDFLVTVSSNGTTPLTGVEVSATADRCAVYVVSETLSQGQVGEVAVVPDVGATGSNVTVTVRAEYQGSVQARSTNFTVFAGDDSRGQRALELRDTFVGWLQTNATGLGITNQTEWLGTIVSPQWLIVEHYLFFSSDWEMHVYWHVMIPPYDWARIDLRPRSTSLVPTLSFEISDVNGSTAVHPIAPANETWR